MSTLLQINTSLFSENGESSRLAHAFVAEWRERNPQDRVIVRDLAVDPVPHLTAERFQAFIADPAKRTEAQRADVACSDAFIDEIRRADVVVLGLPMYNFGVPSTLKAYFDHIARAGQTFRYTGNGSVGLLTGKKAYVFAARGGKYVGTPLDTQTSYVRNFLRFIGIADVEFVYAEGLAIDAATKQAALENARQATRRLAQDTLSLVA